jgi:hypothetical protein
MDDFRVGSIPSSDPVGYQRTDGSSGRKKRRNPDPQGAEDDVVSLFEHASEDEEEDGAGYQPHPEKK